MSSTEHIIDSLAAEATPITPIGAPGKLAYRLGALLTVYAMATIALLGLRADLAVQFTRPVYLAEIALLFLVAITSLTAAVYRAFPDVYQHVSVTRWPRMAVGLFLALLVLEQFLPPDARAVILAGHAVHRFACTLCIAGVATLPSILAMLLLRKGASTEPATAGSHAVLAAAATGCLIMRLIEANDDTEHLILYHYLPTLGFAMLGGILGKTLLKW